MGGATSGASWSDTHQERGRHAKDPHHATKDQHHRHDRVGRWPLPPGTDHPAPAEEPLEPGSRQLHAPGERSHGGQRRPSAPRPAPRPPDGIVSGEAGTWHPVHAHYCLRRSDWTATWRFHLDGWQQLEAIPQHQRMAETPTATNLCHVFAIHQFRALAMGRQLHSAIRTQMEAQAAHAALVHEILSALRSALVRSLGNPPGPWTTASRNQEHTPMNTRGGTIGTATPRPTRHTRALPTAADHWQQKGTILHRRTLQVPEGRCSRYTTTHCRAHVARVPDRPPAAGEMTRQPWDRLVPPVAPMIDVKPEATEPAINCNDSGQADLALEHNPTMRDRAKHSANACWSGVLTRVASSCPAYAAGTKQIPASLGGPTTDDVEHEH